MALRVKDIAQMLGISPATVSLVLNNKPGVSKETRQKVLKLVDEMGYSTNVLSKPALKNNRNIRFIIYKKHGLVVSDTPFFSELMEGIDQESRDNGYNLVISYLNETENNKTEIIRLLEENPPDGLLLLATEMNSEDLKPFGQLNFPVVLLDSCFNSSGLDTVLINNREGAFEAVKHLVECNHTKIGYLHSSVRINNFDERKEGFFKALDDFDIKPNKKYTLSLESTFEGAFRDMSEILQSNVELPTAFFADNDIIAFGAIKALRENGLRIPHDISVVGFDNMPFSEMIDPPMTTIKVFKKRMGMIAVKRLIDRIEGEIDEAVKVEVGVKLIKRDSVLTI